VKGCRSSDNFGAHASVVEDNNYAERAAEVDEKDSGSALAHTL